MTVGVSGAQILSARPGLGTSAGPSDDGGATAGETVSHTALETNKTVIREFYAAMNARDVDTCFAHYAAGAQLDVLVAGPFGGRQPASRESLVAFFAAFPRIDFRVESLTAEGDRVAVEVTSRGELPDGQTYGNRYHNLFVLKDSKIAFFREYPTGIAARGD